MAKDKKLKKSKSSSAVSESKPTAAAAAVVTKPVKKSDVKSTTKETKKSSKTITKSKSKKESESDEEEDDDDMDIESNADLEEEEEEEGSDEEEEVEGENEGKSELENEESDDDEMEEEEEEEGSDDEDMEDEKKSKKTKKTSSDDSETKAVSESKKSKDKSKDKESKDVKDIKDNQKSDYKSNSKSQCLTDLTFDKLGLHDNLLKGLTDAGFSKQFEIQARSIPHLLKGEDVLGSAKTGSGKTLAFLVPMIDTLVKTKFIQKNGTGLLVIAPTRELADQIYSVAREIMKYLSQTHGVVLGGMNRREEAKKLERGVNVLVATPGRLLDHLQNTKGFVYHNLISLVLDEADRILEIGFEEEMHAILRLLPAQRQTALFSATQTKKVADLVRLSMKRPVFIEVKSDDNLATREGLQQGYVVCEADKRFLLLYTFLKREYLVNKSKNIDKKIIVFMSSKHAVKYFTSLLNYIDLQCDCIHGDKKQTQRTSVFQQFSVATRGVLLATNVAARGLDIPKVDWIVQFDPPDDPREYIHRVGRTARGANGIGKALLFLLPSELGFLRYLKKSGVEPDQFVFPENKIANIQVQLERIIEKNFHLHRESRDAYKSYIHAYAAHSLKDCFEVEKLDLAKVAKSFGFSAPPKVELAIKHRVKKGGDKKKAAAMIKNRDSEGSNSIINPHDRFSAHNPYGKRERGDKRQFMK